MFLTRSALLHLVGTCLMAVALAGCQSLMPTPEQPYQLASPDAPTPSTSGWTWVDSRSDVPLENAPTVDGMRFGDAVMSPRPFDHLRAEFESAVARHDAASELRAKLAGKTIHLQELTIDVGLWVRFTQRQGSNWEFVRVRMVVDVDGARYEVRDVHRFDNSERPSPLSIPLRNVAENLVRQIQLF